MTVVKVSASSPRLSHRILTASTLATALLLLPLAAAADAHVRVLAASCAACHGSDGNSIGGTPVLAGLDRIHFVTQMQAFREGKLASTVMYHHAKGLTEQEIVQLAEYFSAQPRVVAISPMPLKGL